MSNLRSHALREFRAAGWTDDDGQFKDNMQEMICVHVLKLLDMFSDEGHSGTSAPYTIQLFKTLAMYEPLSPLTGEDWEWVDVSDRGDGSKLWQNSRCSRVFKDQNGAYDIEGVVFYDWYTDEDGKQYKRYKAHYTNSDSRVPVTFPYTPTTEFKETPNDNT